MLTLGLDLKSILIAILLVALIVLVVFLIVTVARLNATLKMANTMLEGGANAVGAAKDKIDNATNSVKETKAKMKGLVTDGAGAAKNFVAKKLSK